LKNKKNNFGFTLIELIVSLSILMLLSSVGINMVKDFNGNQKLESAKEEILANLRLARNYAMTNQLSIGATGVVFNLNNGVVMIKDTGKTFLSKTIFTSEIKATIGSSIIFSVTDGRSLNGDVGITLASNLTTSTKNILIQKSGNIYEQ